MQAVDVTKTALAAPTPANLNPNANPNPIPIQTPRNSWSSLCKPALMAARRATQWPVIANWLRIVASTPAQYYKGLH